MSHWLNSLNMFGLSHGLPHFLLQKHKITLISTNHYSIKHWEGLGVQLTASVSIINSGLGLPALVSSPLLPATNTFRRKVYVVPGFKPSMLVCNLFCPFREDSFALIDFCCPSVSHFYRQWIGWKSEHICSVKYEWYKQTLETYLRVFFPL